MELMRLQNAPLRFRPVRPALNPTPAARRLVARDPRAPSSHSHRRRNVRPDNHLAPKDTHQSTIAPPHNIPRVLLRTRQVPAKSCPCRATELGEHLTWHFMPGYPINCNFGITDFLNRIPARGKVRSIPTGTDMLAVNSRLSRPGYGDYDSPATARLGRQS